MRARPGVRSRVAITDAGDLGSLGVAAAAWYGQRREGALAGFGTSEGEVGQEKTVLNVRNPPKRMYNADSV